MRSTLVGLMMTVVGLSSTGCSPEPASPPPVPASAKPREIELKDVTLSQLDEFVAKQKGKVVLIDCWATTCAPCVKLFPHTVALHEKHGQDGLVVVTVCTDPDDYRGRAEKFLKDKKATCVNFFLNDPKPAKALEEKYPTEALPAFVLFDREGSRVKALTFSDADAVAVDEAVESLLAGK
jgi:thiol-disulfide isomerase/thioredoxin